MMTDKEIISLCKKKGVAIGMIQLPVNENCGGVQEYNDFIGIPECYLTQEEFDELVKVFVW